MAALFGETYPEYPAETTVGSDDLAPERAPPPPPDLLDSVVEALSRALELHDYRRGSFGETSDHSRRVTELGLRLATEVAPALCADPQLRAGFRLHDIGMIGIPVSVIAKQGPLTPEEVGEIREHPWLGERIVAPLACLNGLARQVIACHHEMWDGSGYPRGLAATEIPVAARVFAVADAYDSITSERPYRDAQTPAQAMAEIELRSGSHFDPQVVTALAQLQASREGAFLGG